MPVLARCALYLAEKSQPLRDLKGDRISSPALSLNQIIKTFGSAEEFAGGLKDLLKYVGLQDREVVTEVNQSITRISFGGDYEDALYRVAGEPEPVSDPE